MYENEKGNRLKVERELENLKTMIGYAKTQMQGALNSIGIGESITSKILFSNLNGYRRKAERQ